MADNLNGYHLSSIKRGKYPQQSKIQEELDELEDAIKQDSLILIMVELADLYGAIEGFAESKGVSMKEVIRFSKITKRAFRSGQRK